MNEARSVQNSMLSRALIADGIDIGNLIHALQVERGQSAGHIASNGKNIKASLPQERLTTDQALAAVSATLRQQILSLHQLREMRTKISDLSVTVPEMAQFYTGAIRKALALSA